MIRLEWARAPGWLWGFRSEVARACAPFMAGIVNASDPCAALEHLGLTLAVPASPHTRAVGAALRRDRARGGS